MMIDFQPDRGDHINRAAEKAILIAQSKHDRLSFKFNGIELVVTEDDSANDVVATYMRKCEESAKAYRESPAGKQAAEADKRTRNSAQVATDGAVASLRTCTSEAAIVRLLVLLAEHVRTDTRWSPSEVADILEARGYRANANLHLPLEQYKDPAISGPYIIGQAIDCLRRGLPPHPVIRRFAEQAYGEIAV